MAGERNGQRQQSPQETYKSRAYAFWVAAIALGVAALAFILTMFIFGGLFDDAATVTAAMGSLFTLTGTVVGAYFAIKVSSDTADRAQSAIRARTTERRGRTIWRGRPAACSTPETPLWPRSSREKDKEFYEAPGYKVLAALACFAGPTR